MAHFTNAMQSRIRARADETTDERRRVVLNTRDVVSVCAQDIDVATAAAAQRWVMMPGPSPSFRKRLQP